MPRRVYSASLTARVPFREFPHTARLFLIALTVFAFSIAAPSTLMNLYFDAAGFDRTFIGLWHASSQFGGIALGIPAMATHDRIGRRHALWLGAAVSIGARAFTVLSTAPAVIVLAEAASGYGTVLFGLAGVSLLADLSSPRNRAMLFSASDAGRSLALLLGGVLFGALPGALAPVLLGPNAQAEAYRQVLIASFALRMCGVIPLMLIARDPAGMPEGERAITRYLDPRVLLGQRLRVYGYAIPFGLVFIADALIFPFFNLFLREHLGLSDAALGAVIGLRGLIGGMALFAAPVLAARLGYARSVVGGALALAACYVVIGASESAPVVVLAALAQAAVASVSMTLYRVRVIDASAPGEFLLVSSALGIAMNAGPAVGPLVSGFVQQQYGFGPLFAAGAVTLLAAAGMFAALLRRA